MKNKEQKKCRIDLPVHSQLRLLGIEKQQKKNCA